MENLSMWGNTSAKIFIENWSRNLMSPLKLLNYVKLSKKINVFLKKFKKLK
jgi:hypothetical protein